MTSSRVVDHDLDRPQVQAQRCVEPSGTNPACGLACFNFTSQKVRFGRLEPSRTLQVSLVPDLRPFQAGGHREAVIPVPIPNTEVKRLIAEGSAGPARARVGRRRPFFFCLRQSFRPFSLCPRVNACSESNRTKFNSDRLGSRADARAPYGFGFAESTLSFASVHSRSAASRCLNGASVSRIVFWAAFGRF